MIKNFLFGATLLFSVIQSHGQTFLNGSFEATTGVCNINLTNSNFNSMMTNCHAFGSASQIDIINSTCGYGSAQQGNYFIGLGVTSNALTDALSLKLSAPLAAGNTYVLKFYNKKDPAYDANLLEVGYSTDSLSFGNTICTAQIPTTSWGQVSLTFTPTVNCRFITIRTIAGSYGWNLVDNFTISQTVTPTINASACDSYTSPSGNYTWTSSGTYMDTIPNMAGCDSVITINLSVSVGQAHLEWVDDFGGTSGSFANSIAVDTNGNSYTTGKFSGTVDFNPGSGVANLTATGGYDIFVLKLDKDKNFVWAKRIGSTSNPCEGKGIAVDISGNVYVTGSFVGNSVDFNPGPGLFNMSSSSSDAFALKLDVNGNFVWAKQVQYGSLDHGNAITVDTSGNVYITGKFGSTADFDPGSGTYNLTATYGYSAFLWKLSPNGDFVWAKALDSPNSITYGYSIAVDGLGNVYSTGSFLGTVDFNPGVSTFNITAVGTSYDIFILKLDVNGNFAWAKSTGGTGDDEGLSLTLDAAGNIYATGSFKSTVDFDLGVGTFNLTSVGANDIFILKLNTNGDFVWAKKAGGGGDDDARAIALDADENVYITGYFRSSSADFDPGVGAFNLAATGAGSGYISKLDSNGSFFWAKRMNTLLDNTLGTSVAIDRDANIYVAGYFSSGTFLFEDVPVVTSSAQFNAFVVKLGPCCVATTSTLTETACGSFTLNSQTYTASGIYTQNFVNSNGCDSIITLNLTISTPVLSTVTQTICFGESVEGYTATGTYTDVFTAVNGCDSTRTLTLTVRAENLSTLNQTICFGESFEGYTTTGNYSDVFTDVNGCDSTRTLNLTVLAENVTTLNQTICFGGSFEGYTTTGNYSDVFTDVNGCDSTRMLNLTVRTQNLSTLNQTICFGENVEGYTTTGNYSDVFTDVNGCDSTRTLNLTVRAANVSALNQTICFGESFEGYTATGSYTDVFTDVNGCDSTRTLNLTVRAANVSTLNQIICFGENFEGYTASGNYSNVFTAVNGCDSTRTLNLIVNNLPQPVIAQENETLTTGVFDSYQWLLDGSPLPGSDMQVITIIQNGDYSVIVTDSEGCTDTSEVFSVINVSVRDIAGENIFEVYPNPNSGNFMVIFSGPVNNISLLDMHGKMVYQAVPQGNTHQVVTADVAAGIYLLRITTAEKLMHTRVIINK